MPGPRTIVDASALLEVLIRGPSTARVREAVLGTEVSAPAHLDAEVVSGLRRLEQTGEITSARAEEALQDLSGFPVVRVHLSGLTREVWTLRHSLTAYDAYYVALARVLDAPLVTGDRRLAGAAGLGIALVVVNPPLG